MKLICFCKAKASANHMKRQHVKQEGIFANCAFDRKVKIQNTQRTEKWKQGNSLVKTGMGAAKNLDRVLKRRNTNVQQML